MKSEFFHVRIKAALLIFCLPTPFSLAQAMPIDYEGTNALVSNCIPFGCPDLFGPHSGFIYRDIAPFSLAVGDEIAFDTGEANDFALSFDLSLASTLTNGGTTADSNGFTTVSSLGSNFFGDPIVGNYDIIFTASTAFNFAGGGLIVDLLNTNGVVSDTTTEASLVHSTNNPFTVQRYFLGSSAGDTSEGDMFAIANLRINTGLEISSVPEPGTLALFAAGFVGWLQPWRTRKPVA